jgi:hypothetical protein
MKKGDIDPIVGTMSTDPFAAFFWQHLTLEAAYTITISIGRFEQIRLEALLQEEGGGPEDFVAKSISILKR